MGAYILIVDDDSDLRFIVTRILKSHGYNVLEASSGAEGIQKVKETDPDLVILDIMMPDMNGWEVCKKIKEVIPQLRVSMLSIKRSKEDVKKSLEAGADRHLTKPLVKDEFLEAVQDLLEEST